MNTLIPRGLVLLIFAVFALSTNAQTYLPDAEQLFKQGTVFHDQMAFDQAIDYYSEVLHMDDEHDRALFNRSLVYLEQGKMDLAYRDINRLVQIRPSDKEAQELRRQLYQQLTVTPSNPNGDLPGPLSTRPSEYASSNYAVVDEMGFSERGIGQQQVVQRLEQAYSLNALDNEVYYHPNNAQWQVINKAGSISNAPYQPGHTEPGNSEGLINRAFYWMELGNYDRALADGRAASEMDVQNARAFYCIGLLKMHFKNYGTAMENFERAIQLDPQNAKLFYFKGIAQYYQKYYLAASESIAQSIEMGRISSEAYSMMGEAKYMAGQYEAALLDQKIAIELDGRNRDAFERLNKCYYSISHSKFAQTLPLANYLNQQSKEGQSDFGEEYEEDLSMTEGSVSDEAQMTPSHYSYDPGKNELLSKALFFNRARRYEEAIPEFDQLIHMDPDNIRAYNGRGFAHFHLKHYEQALQDFSVAIDIDPDFSEANYNRGNVYFVTGQFRKALKDYDRAIEEGQDYADAYYMRAQCHTRLNHSQAALSDYDQCLDVHPTNVNALNNRGSLRLMTGNVFGALEDYNEAIVIDPEKAVLYANRARLKSYIMNYESAVTDYNIAIDLEANDPELYFHRGLTLMKNDDFESAIIDFTKAIAGSDDELYDYYYNRALAFHSLGQFNKAIADYNRTIELNPSHQTAFYNRATSKKAISDEQGAASDYARAEQLGVEQTLSLKKQ
ncbi:MAG: tetratricopeptide repeat protein [Bacteroidota bacterium]